MSLEGGSIGHLKLTVKSFLACHRDEGGLVPIRGKVTGLGLVYDVVSDGAICKPGRCSCMREAS